MFRLSYGFDVLAMHPDGYKNPSDLKPSLLMGPLDTTGGSSFSSSSASSVSSRSQTESYDTPFETPLQDTVHPAHSTPSWNAPMTRGSDHLGPVLGLGLQASPTPSTSSHPFRTEPGPSSATQIWMPPADTRPLERQAAPPQMYYGAPQPLSADRPHFSQAERPPLAPAFTAQLPKSGQAVNPVLSLAKDTRLPSAGPSASATISAAGGGSKQSRHLACSFCRGRKLRCILDDEGQPCRQCQVRRRRRHLEGHVRHTVCMAYNMRR